MHRNAKISCNMLYLTSIYHFVFASANYVECIIDSILIQSMTQTWVQNPNDLLLPISYGNI